MLEGLFTWLLLPLGGVLGWALARRAGPSTGHSRTLAALGGMFSRMSDDDPDAAIDTLTQAGSSPDSAAELQITLGNLFRKRGEVDRALKLHEAVLARTDLHPAQRHLARFEQAQDFLKAGFLDRAEAQFEQLAAEGVQVVPSLEQILAIFEQGRDWKHAIDAARRLEAAKGESRRAVIAQYYCELAEEARQDKQLDAALKLADKAVAEHKESVRAWMTRARIEQEQGNYLGAAASWRKAFDHDPRFLPEIAAPLGDCYAQARDATGYLEFLRHARETAPGALSALIEARLMRREGMDAGAHLAAALQAYPSRGLLVEFLEVLEQRPEAASLGLTQPAASLRAAVGKLIEANPRYRCGQCGFTSRVLFWQCPTCRQWGSIAPIEDTLQPKA